MSLNDAASIVARKLRAQGFTPAQTAGVLGNFKQESGFNPRVNEGGFVGAPKGRGGFGLAQWTGGRQSALVNFAKKRGADPGDPNLQADFLLYELAGPEKAAAASLRQAQSPEQAALIFRRDFERAGIPKDEVRMKAARQLLPAIDALGAPQTATGPAPTGQRSVEEILSSSLGLGQKAGLEDANAKSQGLLGSVRDTLLKSVLSTIVNPTSLIGLP
jgi:hypothetical protein